MRTKFDQQLDLLNVEMIKMGALCEDAISKASKALMEGDSSLLPEVFEVDSQIDRKEAAENQQHLNVGNAVAVYPLKRLQGIGNGIPQKRQVQDKARQLLGNQRAQGIDKDHTAHGIQKRRHIQIGQVEEIDHRQIERKKHALRQRQAVVFSQPLAAS